MERRKRAAEKAKIAAKKRGLQAVRDKQKKPGDISDDLYVERNSLSALSSLSVTETEPMATESADEVKRQVTFTQAIDIFVERASASTEMSILHNIFLTKNDLI